MMRPGVLLDARSVPSTVNEASGPQRFSADQAFTLGQAHWGTVPAELRERRHAEHAAKRGGVVEVWHRAIRYRHAEKAAERRPALADLVGKQTVRRHFAPDVLVVLPEDFERVVLLEEAAVEGAVPDQVVDHPDHGRVRCVLAAALELAPQRHLLGFVDAVEAASIP